MFAAQNVHRYDRQRLIAEYEELMSATFVAVIDQILPTSMTYLEELLFDAEPDKPLHMLLASPGGDGETAIRMVRSLQSRCSELTVILPDMAKSAATLICLGADRIIMGPGGDLGPVDPQFMVADRSLVSAKEMIAAIDEAENRISANENTLPLFAALLEDVTMLMVLQARTALTRSEALVREALACVRSRDEEELDKLAAALKRPLIDEPASHSAVVSAKYATDLGLPAETLDVTSDQWQIIWNLWTRYFSLGCYPAKLGVPVYEGRRASLINRPEQAGQS